MCVCAQTKVGRAGMAELLPHFEWCGVESGSGGLSESKASLNTLVCDHQCAFFFPCAASACASSAAAFSVGLVLSLPSCVSSSSSSSPPSSPLLLFRGPVYTFEQKLSSFFTDLYSFLLQTPLQSHHGSRTSTCTFCSFPQFSSSLPGLTSLAPSSGTGCSSVLATPC